MTEQKFWTDEYWDTLANIHPTEIERIVIPDAIEQVILDYEDALYYYDPEYDQEAIDLTVKLIDKWKRIQKMVNDDG